MNSESQPINAIHGESASDQFNDGFTTTYYAVVFDGTTTRYLRDGRVVTLPFKCENWVSKPTASRLDDAHTVAARWHDANRDQTAQVS